MLKSVFLAATVAVFAAVPAFAVDACGSGPVAPAIPTVSDISGKTPEDAHTIKLDALKNVRIYQAALQPYYNCVETKTTQSNTAIAEAKKKNDNAKVAALQDDAATLQKNYQQTLATEKQVVADYMALHEGYCKMGVGLAGCPKPK
jgi:hypothetical protein